MFRFLAIHPFQDGNGRLGRGLFLLALLQSPDNAIASIARLISIDRHIERHKAEYYAVLNMSSNGKFLTNPSDYKIEYFLDFMIKVTIEALDDISYYIKKFEAINNLSESAEQVLKCFKDYPEIRLSTQIIMNETGLARRTIVNSLNVLLGNKLIQKYGRGAGVRYQLMF